MAGKEDKQPCCRTSARCIVLRQVELTLVCACLQVGTEKLIVQGRVRLTLKPLMDELPIVGAIQARTCCRFLLFG